MHPFCALYQKVQTIVSFENVPMAPKFNNFLIFYISHWGGTSDEFNGRGHWGAAPPQYSPHTTESVPPIFWRLGGGGQDFGSEAPKSGAEGALFENFNDFSEKKVS